MALRDYSEDDDFYEQNFGQDGVVSVWVGLLGDEGDTELDVLQDMCGVGYYRLSDQENNCFDFQLVSLRELLKDLSYAATYLDQVLLAAEQKGITEARWVVVQYDFQYDPTKVLRTVLEDPVFIGVFPYSVT